MIIYSGNIHKTFNNVWGLTSMIWRLRRSSGAWTDTWSTTLHHCVLCRVEHCQQTAVSNRLCHTFLDLTTPYIWLKHLTAGQALQKCSPARKIPLPPTEHVACELRRALAHLLTDARVSLVLDAHQVLLLDASLLFGGELWPELLERGRVETPQQHGSHRANLGNGGATFVTTSSILLITIFSTSCDR